MTEKSADAPSRPSPGAKAKTVHLLSLLYYIVFWP